MFKKITFGLILALILIITAPSCGPQRNEAAEAARAVEWLKQHGADPAQLDKLSNKQVIELKEAVERGETSITTGGVTIDIVPGRPALKDDPYHPDKVRERQTTELDKLRQVIESELREAERLGYNRVVKNPPFDSHGQKVYTNGVRYITRDVDSHIGGVWKMFDRHGQRIGTYDANLNYLGK